MTAVCCHRATLLNIMLAAVVHVVFQARLCVDRDFSLTSNEALACAPMETICFNNLAANALSN